ncbi:MAG: hypothetical protein J7K61_04060 [Thermoplasmata archaeon]|nr:hypothetical protein [Thermoplasmata archaeon]
MFRKVVPLAVAILLLAPIGMAEKDKNLPSGFEGVSWSKVVPVRKATVVNFDEDSLVDDFAYMAAIPASTFYDDKTGRIYSYPVLFYNDYVKGKEETLSLNDRQGLDYFMEDWIGFNKKLKEIEYINMDKKPWKADNYTYIKSNDIYEIASKLALHDWSYSNNAVIALVGDINYGSYNKTTHTIKGELNTQEIKHIRLTGVKQDSLAPQYDDFYVDDNFKYIKADLWWPSISWFPMLTYMATVGMLQGGLTIPSADPDLQLYCYYDGELMQVAATENWNVMAGPQEHAESYIYSPGKWKTAITDIPTKSIGAEPHGTIIQRMMDRLLGKVTYYIDIDLYPGKDVDIVGIPPFMARNADFELTWNGDAKLGMVLVDKDGAAIAEAVSDNVSKQTLHVDQLGEGEYKMAIIQLTPGNGTVKYTLKYSWESKLPREQANYIMNAAEGAVIASIKNAPLLYTPSDKLDSRVKDVIHKLGVKNVCVVSIGNENATALGEIRSICSISKLYTKLTDMYKDIRNETKTDDVVFTTIDPWTYWLVEKLKPEGEKEGALYVGPAAYLAAHHGAPLIAVDMHPELSTAVVWYNEWWKRHAIRDIVPSVSDMYLSGRKVYDFLAKAGLDEAGKKEYLITVAGQFDIGIPWDRTFVGLAYPGRIIGTPVDTSYWVARSVFYPAIIFQNPALNKDGIMLINGSKSVRLPSGRLKIVKPSQDERFYYPVLNSWITYTHRFNERASHYWGFNYTCADGITPYYDPSTNPIDNNVLAMHGKYGAYWPDLSESEITPFYLRRAGYDVAFTTNFTATMENLNRGVIMWIETTHGWHMHSGSIAFWDPYGTLGFMGINISLPTVDKNPWRGYEIYLPGYWDGSTEEPDVLSQSKMLGVDIVPARASTTPIIKHTWLGKRAGFDGVVITVLFGRLRTKDYTGIDIDRSIGNIHSMGFSAGSCLISNTYLHLTLIRHGSVFQVIDPWETSWYSAFSGETFARDIALGSSVGEAYANGIHHVGIEYLTKQWWWDIKENVCYFGDPKLHVYTPNNPWDKPDSLAENDLIDGHAMFGATSYPHQPSKQDYTWWLIGGIVAIAAIGAVYIRKKGMI